MSREIRRVPIDWQHPTIPNPNWQYQRSLAFSHSKPPSRLHGPTEMFRSLFDDYPGALASWEQEGRDLAARTGSSWEFSVEWHFTGYDDCSCHPGEIGVKHPVRCWSEDGQTEVALPIQTEDELHAHLLAEHQAEKPDPAGYMPVFDVPEDELGWCLYQTVSEGTPVTPVFATAEELVEHLCTIGEDYDQQPYRRAAAETLVRTGSSFGSLAVVGGQVYDSAKDADLLAAAISSEPKGA